MYGYVTAESGKIESPVAAVGCDLQKNMDKVCILTKLRAKILNLLKTEHFMQLSVLFWLSFDLNFIANIQI